MKKWRFISLETHNQYFLDAPTLEAAMESLNEPCFTIIKRYSHFDAVANPSWAFPDGKSESARTMGQAMTQIMQKFDAIKQNGGPIYYYVVADRNKVKKGGIGMLSRVYSEDEKHLAELELDRIKAKGIEESHGAEPFVYKYQS